MSESRDPIQRLLDVVSTLRGEDGCPWDREQTLSSLKPYLIEEAYELIDAIDDGDILHHREELGDVLLQVVLQSQIRSEMGDFDFAAVAGALADKLIARHPHVFGDLKVTSADDVLANWETLKSKEKQQDGKLALDGIPRHLPALQRAQRVQSRVARVGFDWDEMDDVMAKVDEELAEVREALERGDMDDVAEEMGDLLFSVVNASRFVKVNAEEALRKTIEKFTMRFREVESRVHAEGKLLTDCSLQELDRHWEAIKAERAS